MVKVKEVLDSLARRRLSPLKREVLEFLETHPEEVFTYRDADLERRLPHIKPAALRFTLWALARDGLIGKATLRGRVYFGSHKAVRLLQQGLASRQAPRGGLRGLWKGVSFTEEEIEEARRSLFREG